MFQEVPSAPKGMSRGHADPRVISAQNCWFERERFVSGLGGGRVQKIKSRKQSYSYNRSVQPLRITLRGKPTEETVQLLVQPSIILVQGFFITYGS